MGYDGGEEEERSLVSDYFPFVLKRMDMSSVSHSTTHCSLLVRTAVAYMVSLLPSKPDFPLPLRCAKASKQNEIIPHPPCGLRGFVICTLRCDLGLNHS